MLDQPEKDIEVYIVRHAQAVGQDSSRVIGRSNELPLTTMGRKQAAEVGKALGRLNLRPSLIYCSPARRTRETANVALYAMRSGLEDGIIEHWALSEVSQGEWEGQPRRDVYTSAVRLQMEAEGLDFSAPGGESSRRGSTRMLNGFLIDEFRGHHPRHLPWQALAFGHGLVTRGVAGILECWPDERVLVEKTPNTSVTQFVRHNGSWRLGFLGKSALEI